MKRLDDLDILVRQGEFAAVERVLNELTIKRIKRNEAVRYANLAKRVGKPLMALSILNPIIRAASPLEVPPTEQEKMEYADSLRKVGAIAEAEQLLHGIDELRFPEALMFKAYCSISRWEYEKAIPLLERYIQIPTIAPYAGLAARLNLSAGYVAENRLQDAARVLGELREIAGKEKHWLILGGTLELSAQVQIRGGDFDEALRILGESAETLKNAGHIQRLWVSKWTAIAKSFKSGRVLPELREVVNTAAKAHNWETIRDCLYYEALIARDGELMTRIYFGTPYRSFRNKIASTAGEWLSLPERYTDHHSFGVTKKIIHVSEGTIDGNQKLFNAGQVLHRLFGLLAQDFFKPLPVVETFGRLFPEEYFNPSTSPNRIHQAVMRLRRLLLGEDVDVQITEINGAYRIESGPTAAICLRRENEPLDARIIKLSRVRKEFGASEFNVQQAQVILGDSPATIKRLVRWAVEDGQLSVVGAGPRTRYRFSA